LVVGSIQPSACAHRVSGERELVVIEALAKWEGPEPSS
jgi:hypothetical protein